MRMAIVTKFLPPTNHRGARIKAMSDAGSLTVSWDYEVGVPENHLRAAEALMQKLGWDWPIVGGALPGSGYAFVEARA